MTALPFPEKIHSSATASLKDAISILAMGDNYQQRIETGLNPQHEEWSIMWPALTTAEFHAAMAVLNTVRCVSSMTWTSPVDGIVKNYVVQPNSRSAVSVGIKWNLSLSLRQVFEP
ncbi:phage tail protein [Methylobacter sp. S3L5C]|uniref:phage tail protein n=1 Tax=Methylobacter sp. S3L5C TaxID=2839024 RepID=UPI001FAD5120|nr:phage tail protein [Methylobacter sp. S3L5C]UOA08322.1 phage tail protein [Methylobacter sp. S3L5C]